jgi:putative tricarboxylic transport membrane protein
MLRKSIHIARIARTGRAAIVAASAAALLGFPPGSLAQGAWQPEKAVELVVGSAPGGGNDTVARVIHKIMQENKLVPVPVAVLNKPGGNQSISRAYILQHTGDPHFFDMGTPTLISNHIAGRSKQHFRDFTPIALMINEYTAITVRADSPIRNARDLVEHLRKDPGSVVIGIPNIGGTNHLNLSLLLKTGGVNLKQLKVVVYRGASEGATALLGGHVHVIPTSVTGVIGLVRDGKARMISLAAPERMGGDLAQVPTLREQGYDVALSNWRSIVGTAGLNPAQVTYWENVLAKVVATDEWKARLDKQFWDGNFLRSREFIQYLEKEYGQTRAVMADLGLAKGN